MPIFTRSKCIIKMSLLKSFPRTFWVANAIELFERWAWYGFFMLFANYLTGSSDAGGLEFSQSQKGILMGVGTGILYFLPVLTGAIADRYGYRKVLCIAFLVYASAFILLPQATTFVGVFLLYITWHWVQPSSNRLSRLRSPRQRMTAMPPSGSDSST